ncbi:MAG: hypothetical protein Pg6C_16150 [Treponemataceae bacterium]|nr:MAG: hypothetical protein Pg6C_16150 [Treponemataceae bacterium]
MQNTRHIKLILAPLATLSHGALRRAIYFFGGCDEYYTEMIHAPTLLNAARLKNIICGKAPNHKKSCGSSRARMPNV